MNRPKWHSILWAIAVIAWPAAAEMPSIDPIDNPAQSLKQLRQRIASAESHLHLAHQEYLKNRNTLLPREQLAGVVTDQLESLRKKIDSNTARAARIHLHRNKVEQQLEDGYRHMPKELIGLVLARSGGALQSLIDAGTAADMTRQLAYHDYIHARQTAYFSQLTRLRKNRSFLAELQERVETYKQKLEIEYLQMLDNDLARQQARQKQQERLHTYMADRQTQINQLFEQEQGLLAFLHQQRRLPAEEKQPGAVEVAGALQEASQKKFAALRGRLHWPAGGIVHNLFNQPARGSSVVPWQGVFIQQQRGQPVKAISDGRVVYADEFKNMGNLLILDHGEGYMSLYAHNEDLRSRHGDWVTRGDIIASIGQTTGNNDQVGLYFEIRHQGYPVNPALWCN